jgi:AcrR family transcriptional regulator
MSARSSNDQRGTRPQVGRPLVLDPQERRARLLRAAMQVFSRKGYTAATVDAIAVEAGMSKKTLYQVFASKMVLFDALLEEQLYRIPIAVDLDGLGPEEELAQLLLSLARYLLDPIRQALVRLIVTDGQASPELMTAFERLEIGRDLNHIEQWIGKQTDAGYLKVADIAATAKLLFGMTIAEPMLSALVQGPLPEKEESLPQQIRQAVHVFLVGVGALRFTEPPTT